MIELVLNPTDTHLHQIEMWLIDERNQYNEGFYCNWNNITDHFNDKELFCLAENEKAIGFFHLSIMPPTTLHICTKQWKGYAAGGLIICIRLILFLIKSGIWFIY